MPISPTAIGENGSSVRTEMQNLFDKIDDLLLDPLFVERNNKASKADQANGGLKFVFTYEGRLNNVEKSTLSNGWESSGWTSSVVVNNDPSPHDPTMNMTWTLTLVLAPTP